MSRTVRSITARTENKSYNIIIGIEILSRINCIRGILSQDKFAIIAGSGIMQLYERDIRKVFSEYDNFDIFTMHDSEENKNYLYAEGFLNEMLKKGYTRKSAVIGIGGGVVGDFAGFIASIFMRGIPVIHIPTTLLAMVDSSIGGKTAVNISAGKNIAGAFHHPEIVISDISFIKTLPDNEFKNGLSEVLKHAVIGEENLLTILEEKDLKSIKDLDIIAEIVYHSALFKSGIVEKDQHENNLRTILNFGHTAGHAIESMLGYKGISHGEAVAIGIKIETEISRQLGWLSEEESKIVNNLINKYELVYNNFKLIAENIIEHMKYDKKNYGNKIRFVLLKGFNNPVYNQEVDVNFLKDVIKGIIN